MFLSAVTLLENTNRRSVLSLFFFSVSFHISFFLRNFNQTDQESQPVDGDIWRELALENQ